MRWGFTRVWKDPLLPRSVVLLAPLPSAPGGSNAIKSLIVPQTRRYMPRSLNHGADSKCAYASGILDRNEVVDVAIRLFGEQPMPHRAFDNDPPPTVGPRVSQGSREPGHSEPAPPKRKSIRINRKGVVPIEPLFGVLECHGCATVVGVQLSNFERLAVPVDADIKSAVAHTPGSRDGLRRTIRRGRAADSRSRPSASRSGAASEASRSWS